MSYAHIPSYPDILVAARATVSALRNLGFHCALAGGVACRMYGNNRSPTDVDVVVFESSLLTEALKARIAQYDRNFSLAASQNSLTGHQHLWYHLPHHKSCKIELLLPGTHNVPPIPLNHVERLNGLPVLPFAAVFLMKLLAWAHHRAAPGTSQRERQHADVADIDHLLPIAIAHALRPRKVSWLPAAFVAAAEARAREYAVRFPESRNGWLALGFDVPRPLPSLIPGAAHNVGPPVARRSRTSQMDGPPRLSHRTWSYRDGPLMVYDSD